MTVRELVNQLEQLPPDAEIKTYDRYDGESHPLYGAGMMWEDNEGDLYHDKQDAIDNALLAECVAELDERVMVPELKQVAVVEIAWEAVD